MSIQNIATIIKYSAIGLLAVVAMILTFVIKDHFDNKQMEVYKKELSGQITKSQKETQVANQQIGTLNSKLSTQQQLNDAIKKDRDSTSAVFEKWKKEHNMVPTSNTDAIIDVKDNCGDRQFKATIEVDREKNGFLENTRLTLTEIDANGQPVLGAKSTVISSNVVYTDVPDNMKDKILTLRWFGDIAYPLFNNLGFGGGIEFISYKNFGLITSVLFDGSSIKNTEVGAGVDYNIRNFNIAPFVEVNTFLSNPLSKNSISFGVLFYIIN